MPCSQEWSRVLPAPGIIPLPGAILISLLNWVLHLLRGFFLLPSPLPRLDFCPSGAWNGGAGSFLVLLQLSTASFSNPDESNLKPLILKVYRSGILMGSWVDLGFIQAASLLGKPESKTFSCSNSCLQPPCY